MSDYNEPLPIPELAHPARVFVVRPQQRRYSLHVLLLLLTFLTTLVVGSHLQYNFDHDLPIFSDADTGEFLPMFPVVRLWEHPGELAMGLPFSLTLMGILLAHEMGHFIYCQRYGVYATLPYFIPAPTLIGTLGAFIRIKSRIHSRAALFDIGIAGPIAGFVVALPVLIASLPYCKPAGPPVEGEIVFGMPAIFYLAHLVMSPFSEALSTPMEYLRLHPVAMAAWVGMFATSLNLLPGGQLDGGHIVYAVAPYGHRWVSRITIAILIPLAVFYWVGWLLWAALLAISGMRHPAVPIWPELGVKRRKFALIALLLLAVTITPAPIHQSFLDFVNAILYGP